MDNIRRLMAIVIGAVAAFIGAGFYMSSNTLTSLYGNFYNPDFVFSRFLFGHRVETEFQITYCVAFVIIFAVVVFLIDKFMIKPKDSKK